MGSPFQGRARKKSPAFCGAFSLHPMMLFVFFVLHVLAHRHARGGSPHASGRRGSRCSGATRLRASTGGATCHLCKCERRSKSKARSQRDGCKFHVCSSWLKCPRNKFHGGNEFRSPSAR